MIAGVPSLKDQLLVSLFDKALLGGVLAGLAYYLNRRIEEFRARRALEGEFLRERTKRLDQLYAMMLDFEIAGGRYTDEASKLQEAQKKPLNLSFPHVADAAKKQFKKLGDDLARTAERFRPWIGDDLAELCAEYRDVVPKMVAEMVAAVSPNDTGAIEKLAERTTALQAAIVTAIREGAPSRTAPKPPPKAV